MLRQAVQDLINQMITPLKLHSSWGLYTYVCAMFRLLANCTWHLLCNAIRLCAALNLNTQFVLPYLTSKASARLQILPLVVPCSYPLFQRKPVRF